MSVLDLTLYPDDPLTKTAKPFDQFGPDLVKLADDMLDTMRAFDGVGLAGPQVGLAKRIFVLCEPDSEPMCLVNPEIVEQEGRESGEEGCLSMPRIYAPVPRATFVKVKAFNPHGEAMEFEARDFLARIIQHEYDHLEGVLFPDRLDILSREDLYQQWADVRKELEDASQRSPA